MWAQEKAASHDLCWIARRLWVSIQHGSVNKPRQMLDFSNAQTVARFNAPKKKASVMRRGQCLEPSGKPGE